MIYIINATNVNNMATKSLGSKHMWTNYIVVGHLIGSNIELLSVIILSDVLNYHFNVCTKFDVPEVSHHQKCSSVILNLTENRSHKSHAKYTW